VDLSRLEEWCLKSLKEGEPKQYDVLSPLAKLTVVVPSYGRQDFLLRQAVYWGNDAAKLVIVDGSPAPLRADVEKGLSAQSNIEYLHLPKDIAARLDLAAKHVHTPYSVLLGDDEFHLKKGLSLAIDKLEKDPALVACIGQSLIFRPSIDRTTLTYSTGYRHWKYEIAQTDIRQRTIAAMSNYNAATCYAVHREPFGSRSWGGLKPWSSPYVGELQQAIATYIFGKLSTVDEVYWLRSYENPPVSIKAEWDLKLQFDDWWLSPKFQLERDEFVGILVSEAVSTGQVEYAEARTIILETVDAYLDFSRRAKQSARTGATIVSGLRSRISRTLRAVMTEKQLLSLKARLFGLFRMREEGNLGSLGDMKRKRTTGTFPIGEDLVSELGNIEDLIVAFHAIRKAGTGND